jgi:hypothetical protein
MRGSAGRSKNLPTERHACECALPMNAAPTMPTPSVGRDVEAVVMRTSQGFVGSGTKSERMDEETADQTKPTAM